MKLLFFIFLAISLISGNDVLEEYKAKHKGWLENSKTFHPKIHSQFLKDCKNYCKFNCEVIKKDYQPQVYEQCWSAKAICVEGGVCN